MIQASDLKVVARIVPQRALRSNVHGKAMKVDLFVSSEFNEPMIGLISQCILSARFYPVSKPLMASNLNSDSDGEVLSTHHQELLRLNISDKDVATYEVTLPPVGTYQLWIHCDSTGTTGALVLDFLSEMFTILDSVLDPKNNDSSGVRRSVPNVPLLQNYRPLYTQSSGWPTLIGEDYGSSLGAHVYDSAVVMARNWGHLHSLAACKGDDRRSNEGVLLELGAGTGAVGLSLARRSSESKFVVLTDKPALKSLIEQNITLNTPMALGRPPSDSTPKQAHACFAAVEWENDADIDALFLQHFKDRPPDVIVAADVLYGNEVSLAFLDVLRRILQKCLLVHPRQIQPLALVGQKLRSTEPFGVAFCSDFDADLLLEECSVRVWRLSLREQS